jgi:hypothetical protein
MDEGLGVGIALATAASVFGCICAICILEHIIACLDTTDQGTPLIRDEPISFV